MAPEYFSPEERIEITKSIRDASGFRNKDVILGEALGLCEEYERNPFVEMERILREMGSDIYLLAVPAEREFIPDGHEIVMPYSGDQEYPFFLLVSVGIEETQEWMSGLWLNPRQNLLNLENTGFLCARKGTKAARAYNYKEN